MLLCVKDWKRFQHYKDRRPPWIKLHHTILDDSKFHRLPVASRALAPMLWLIASEFDGGAITLSPDEIAWRLRMPITEFNSALKALIDNGFIIQEGIDSAALAEHKQEAMPETETEAKGEREPEREIFTAADCAGYVIEHLHLSGREYRWLAEDAIKQCVKALAISNQAAAEYIVGSWIEYSKTDGLKGKKGFLGEGDFLPDAKWRRNGERQTAIGRLLETVSETSDESFGLDGTARTGESQERRVPPSIR